MKKNQYFVMMVLLCGFFSVQSLSAQTTVSDFATFDAVFQQMKAGEGGEIQLGASIIFEQDYVLGSTAQAPIRIVTTGYSLIVKGTGTTDTSPTLTVTDNVTIEGEGSVNLISNQNKGKVCVTGGHLNKTGTQGAVLNLTAGNGKVTGGVLESSSNRLINLQNSYNVEISGGEFTSHAANGRNVYASGANTKVTITGGVFTTDKTGACSVLMDDNSTNCSALITGGSFNGEGTAFRTQKNSVVVIRDAVTNSGTNKDLGSTSSKIYDFRSYTISATPESGEYSANPIVTLTMTDNNDATSAEGAVLRYTITEEALTSASDEYSVAFELSLPGKVKAVAEKNGYLGKEVVFSYQSISSGLNHHSDNMIIAYPLVSSDYIYLKGQNESCEVAVFDMNGRLVMPKASRTFVNVSTLVNGIYLMKVYSSKGVQTIRFCKKSF